MNKFVTWPEVHRDTKELVRRLMDIGSWKGIVAVTRGGLVPATILAREMEIRFGPAAGTCKAEPPTGRG